jgi:L-2-hydroxyglutarate oxidase
MTASNQYDFAVIGGGILGLATARALLQRQPAARLVVLEKEAHVAAHQTGRNSGVIHSGVYYPHGSLKQQLTSAGRAALLAFCEEQGLPYELCGKVIVATQESELPLLETYAAQAQENGLRAERLDAGGLAEIEPAARGLAALWLPEAGIVDFGRVARALAQDLHARGAELRTGFPVAAIAPNGTGLRLRSGNAELRAGYLVNCAGLFSDRVARLAGVDPGLRIVPFRGEYFKLAPGKRSLVRGLIYPLPDPRFPFLGVHLTRRIDGEVLAGPNALLSLAREGYRSPAFNLRDTLDTLTYPGFWKLALANLSTGLGEMLRAWSVAAFARQLQVITPQIGPGDLLPARAGVRAQALDKAGNLVKDFHIVRGERSLHVVNAPSPAATAGLAIGAHVAEMALADG